MLTAAPPKSPSEEQNVKKKMAADLEDSILTSTLPPPTENSSTSIGQVLNRMNNTAIINGDVWKDYILDYLVSVVHYKWWCTHVRANANYALSANCVLIL